MKGNDRALEKKFARSLGDNRGSGRRLSHSFPRTRLALGAETARPLIAPASRSLREKLKKRNATRAGAENRRGLGKGTVDDRQIPSSRTATGRKQGSGRQCDNAVHNLE